MILQQELFIANRLSFKVCIVDCFQNLNIFTWFDGWIYLMYTVSQLHMLIKDNRFDFPHQHKLLGLV